MHGISNLAAAAGEEDLVGNWSWTVWLLIPVVLLLALLTAMSLGGSDDEDDPALSRGGGVSRYLSRTTGADATEREAR